MGLPQWGAAFASRHYKLKGGKNLINVLNKKKTILLLSSRGHQKVFEAWFLLVQCAHWVQVCVQLLGTSGLEDRGPLLWLLTFYHHPTNRGHHRDLQLVRVQKLNSPFFPFFFFFVFYLKFCFFSGFCFSWSSCHFDPDENIPASIDYHEIW